MKIVPGGIAGSVTTANVTGLLNNTLGIGNFLGFTVHHVTVTGVNDGYTVEAKENYAGGAIGEAVGGDVDTVTLNQVKSVTAKNRVGGFIGCAGPGRSGWWKRTDFESVRTKQFAESRKSAFCGRRCQS